MPSEVEPDPSPVALVVFNRPDATRRCLEHLALGGSRRLYLIADGPRGRQDQRAVAETRRVVEDFDWPGEVVPVLSAENLGCPLRVTSGLDRVFEREDRVIVVEDDVLVEPSFLGLCDHALERYLEEPRVGAIRSNGLPDHLGRGAPSYSFCRLFSPWGWATWRRAWEGFDRAHFASPWLQWLRRHPRLADLRGSLLELGDRVLRPMGWPAWHQRYQRPGLATRLKECGLTQRAWMKWAATRRSPRTWAGAFAFHLVLNDLLVLTPAAILSENIGFGAEATITRRRPPWHQEGSRSNLILPPTPPEVVELDRELNDRMVADLNRVFAQGGFQ